MLFVSVLFGPVLFSPMLFSPMLFVPVLFSPVLFVSMLFGPVLFVSVLGETGTRAEYGARARDGRCVPAAGRACPETDVRAQRSVSVSVAL
ncbi:hypothetical protein ACFVFH_29755 [Streptomyces sp. NPDC057697]|uniref:hypothetical protein n=1 Tax=Streptomyces sp. NPDC057697 TaxID=3346219 RepID=UPI0036995B13